MRRHGLKARIRQQRRLARRLATQHPMARRRYPGARMLEVLGELSDEPVTPSRFVPPAESAPTVPQGHPEIMPPQYFDVHDYSDISAQPVDAQPEYAPPLDAPSPFVAPSRPQRIAPASVHDVPPAVPASVPVVAMPNDRAPSAVDAPRAQPRHTPPGSRAGEGHQQETQADRAVPRNTAPPPQAVESRQATTIAQRFAIPKPSHQGANETSSRSDVHAAITVDSAADDTVRSITAPGSSSPGQSPTEPKSVEATSTGGAPTQYDAIVARALAALRASGELPEGPRRAPPPAAPTARAGSG